LIVVVLVAFSLGYLLNDNTRLFGQEAAPLNQEDGSGSNCQSTGTQNIDGDESNTQVQELVNQIDILTNEIDGLEIRITELTDELAKTITELETSNNENNELTSRINNLEYELTQLETTLLRKQEEIGFLDTRRDELEAELEEIYDINIQQAQEIADLEDTNNRILDLKITQHYEWVYGGWLWQDRYQWDLSIPLSLYWRYRDQPRPESYSQWIDMAKDPGDNSYIDTLAKEINKVAQEEDFTETEKVEFVIGFVQSLPYTVDSVTTPWNEYPRYPIETLFDRGGDCEDTSILVVALLNRLGYDTCLLLLHYEQHAAVGVSISGASGSYYIKNDIRYYYVETTSEGYEIGEIPNCFTQTSAYVYPLDN